MRRKKQQNPKKRLRNWFFKGSTNEFISLKKIKWENSDKKVVGSYNRGERRICAKEGKGIFIVKRIEKRDAQVYWRTVEKRIY